MVNQRSRPTPALDLLKAIFKDTLLPTTQNLMEEASIMKVPVHEDNRFPHLLFRHAQSQHGELLPFFDRIEGLNKLCDYILFAETADTLYVCCVELKENTGTALPQLNAAEMFVDFVFRSCERINQPINKEIKFFKIKIKATRKRRTSEQDFLPDAQGVIHYPEFDFRIANLIA